MGGSSSHDADGRGGGDVIGDWAQVFRQEPPKVTGTFVDQL